MEIKLQRVERNDLILALKDYFKNEDSPFDFHRISELVAKLLDNVVFFIEQPYIDIHYQDSFYLYFLKKFKPFSKYCVRVHIFFDSVSDFLCAEDSDYLGFFIVRPLSD